MPNVALDARQFASYPPQARALAVAHLGLLGALPLALRAALLREVIAYDWKFPAERKELEAQFAYLGGLAAEQRAAVVAPFQALNLSDALQRYDLAGDPQGFVEQLTAHLWATSQMDAFRAAADTYASGFNSSSAALKAERPSLCMVILGQGVERSAYPLFRKLSPDGVHFTQIKPQAGLDALWRAAVERARKQTAPFAHWYVDGGMPLAGATEAPLTAISWSGLQPVREALTAKMSAAARSGTMGPEGLRSMLAKLRPEDLGLKAARENAVLDHFKVSLFTEGSGTQVYSTTFVQWAARELYRRARPETLLLRFAPRQRARPLNELIAEQNAPPQLDAEGSLMDADMGAYYTWLNQKRVTPREHTWFLAWFEGHNEAFAISPNLPQGTRSEQPAELGQVLEWMGMA